MTDDSTESRLNWVRTLLERYERSLLHYALRFTGNADRARDVVQDTFLRLCEADRAKLDGRMPQWLFTVCRNRALDVRRKESRMTTLEHVQAASGDETRCDPSELIERAEGTTRVLAALDALPEKQQEVLRLRFHGGLSYQAIAAVTELSVSNVGYLIHVGIRSVREQLQTQPGERPSCDRSMS